MSGGLYDRFGGGYSAGDYAPPGGAFDEAAEVEYQSPYSRQDRY